MRNEIMRTPQWSVFVFSSFGSESQIVCYPVSLLLESSYSFVERGPFVSNDITTARENFPVSHGIVRHSFV